MIYDLEWLKNFDGKMLPSQVDMAELANSIEVYVSQFRYVYTTSLADYPSINIEVRNGNIPHLLGLSKLIILVFPLVILLRFSPELRATGR
ncbi:hypothetical protein [Levilactobacillus cerevisiae]|uniref:hypothetical protein n=1 Tax=Levilactobacillus cerevisiae TaxID=1704076 RepID=UPI000F772C47|nr:hypothetical protein [Levilactobacillus cerevisiae]